MEALSFAAASCRAGRVNEAAVAVLRTALETEAESEQEEQCAHTTACDLYNASRMLDPDAQVSHLAMRQLSCSALERSADPRSPARAAECSAAAPCVQTTAHARPP